MEETKEESNSGILKEVFSSKIDLGFLEEEKEQKSSIDAEQADSIEEQNVSTVPFASNIESAQEICKRVQIRLEVIKQCTKDMVSEVVDLSKVEKELLDETSQCKQILEDIQMEKDDIDKKIQTLMKRKHEIETDLIPQQQNKLIENESILNNIKKKREIMKQSLASTSIERAALSSKYQVLHEQYPDHIKELSFTMVEESTPQNSETQSSSSTRRRGKSAFQLPNSLPPLKGMFQSTKKNEEIELNSSSIPTVATLDEVTKTEQVIPSTRRRGKSAFQLPNSTPSAIKGIFQTKKTEDSETSPSVTSSMQPQQARKLFQLKKGDKVSSNWWIRQEKISTAELSSPPPSSPVVISNRKKIPFHFGELDSKESRIAKRKSRLQPVLSIISNDILIQDKKEEKDVGTQEILPNPIRSIIFEKEINQLINNVNNNIKPEYDDNKVELELNIVPTKPELSVTFSMDNANDDDDDKGEEEIEPSPDSIDSSKPDESFEEEEEENDIEPFSPIISRHDNEQPVFNRRKQSLFVALEKGVQLKKTPPKSVGSPLSTVRKQSTIYTRLITRINERRTQLEETLEDEDNQEDNSEQSEWD